MNAFTRTAQSMVTTLNNIGRQLPPQDVRILVTEFGGPLGPRYVVAVANQYFRVLDITLQQLRMGISAGELELTEIDPDTEEEF